MIARTTFAILLVLLAVSGAGAADVNRSRETPAAGAAESSSSSLTGAGLKLLVGSVAMAALLYGAMRLVRRLPLGRFLPGTEGPIRVTARTYLGAKESLCLVDVGPASLLLAVSGQTVTTLHVWPEGLDVTPAGTTRPETAWTPPAPPPLPGQLGALQARLRGRR
jgi:flagellar biogenesis protein FliO